MADPADAGMRLCSSRESRRDFWRSVQALYLSGAHCDLRLVCQGGACVPCHRLVLASVSGVVLRALLDSGEEDEAAASVQLPGIGLGSARAVVDGIYSFLAHGEAPHGGGLDAGGEEAARALGVDLQGRPFTEGVALEKREEEDVSPPPHGSSRRRPRRKGGKRTEEKTAQNGGEELKGERIPAAAKLEEDGVEEKDWQIIMQERLEFAKGRFKISGLEEAPKLCRDLYAQVVECRGEVFAQRLSGGGNLYKKIDPEKTAFVAFCGIRATEVEGIFQARPLAWMSDDDDEISRQFQSTCGALESVLGVPERDLHCQRAVLMRLEEFGRTLRCRTRRKMREQLALRPRQELESLASLGDRKTKQRSPCLEDRTTDKPLRFAFKEELLESDLDGVVVLSFLVTGEVEAREVLISTEEEAGSDGAFRQCASIIEALFLCWDLPGPGEEYCKRRPFSLSPIAGVISTSMERRELKSVAREYLALGKEAEVKTGEEKVLEDELQKPILPKEAMKEGDEERKDTAAVCETCGVECPSQRALYRHKYNNHAPRRCRFCPADAPDSEAVLIGELALVSHMRRLHPEYTGHDKTPAVCDNCGRRFSSTGSLRRHVLMAHTDEREKPHRCDSCPRGFPNPSALRAHVIMAHLKTRPFACRAGGGCAAAYNDNASLHTHERKAHGMHQNSKRARKNP